MGLQSLLEGRVQELAHRHCEVLLILHLFAVEVSEGENAHRQDVSAFVAIDEALDELEYLHWRWVTLK